MLHLRLTVNQLAYSELESAKLDHIILLEHVVNYLVLVLILHEAYNQVDILCRVFRVFDTEFVVFAAQLQKRFTFFGKGSYLIIFDSDGAGFLNLKFFSVQIISLIIKLIELVFSPAVSSNHDGVGVEIGILFIARL